MGVSNSIVVPFYQKYISKLENPIALLGSSDNSMFEGDLYDMSLGNWNINDEWTLPKSYQTIICTRCAYFCRDPLSFVKKCHMNLEEGGMLYVDWGLGDHWRFKNFKVGWIKNGEQEHAYQKDNFLWSAIWNDSFLSDENVQWFSNEIKDLGYKDLGSSIKEEVPSILDPESLTEWFDYDIKFLFVKKPYLQLYMLFRGEKR